MLRNVQERTDSDAICGSINLLKQSLAIKTIEKIQNSVNNQSQGQSISRVSQTGQEVRIIM